MEHLIKLVTTAELVQSISLWVSIAVIILLFITLSSSFYIYYRYYRRCIDHELEDEYIRKEIKGENKKFFKNFEKLRDDENLSKEAKVEEYRKELLVDHVAKKMRVKNGLKILANTVLVLTYIVFIFAMTFALYTRASGEQFYLGDTSYVVIQSGSMDEPVETNTYIQDNNLTDQIRAYSLIGLEKVESESDIELYDIVAYYNNEGELIVHRVISIQTNDQGETTYTLRGDANSFTDDIERALTFNQIEAKYNGFQNFGLGIVINYARSNIGIITISLGLILIAVYDFFDIILGKRINVRKEILYPIMDEENINELGGYIEKVAEEVEQIEEVIEQIPTQEEISQVVVEGVEEVQEEPVNEEVVEEVLETLKEPQQETLETLKETKAAPQTEIIEGEDKTFIAPIPVIVPLEGEEIKKPRKKMVPFVKKLARIDDDLKKKYEELRNYCLSYGLKERISVPYNTFRLKKVRYVVFAIRGKALILHFALEYKDYEDSPITVKDDSVKVKYEDVPVLFRVKSNLSLKRAYILIDDTMARANIERKYDFVSLYKDNQLDDTDDDNLDLDIDYDDEEYEEYEEEVVETEETQTPSETDVIPLIVPVEEPAEEVEEDLEDDDDDDEKENEEEAIKIAPDETSIKKPFVKFITRLENLNEDLRLKYQELVNYSESFGLKGRISRTCMTFRLKRNKYLVIQIRGKALKLHYNLVEADLGEDNKIPVKDHSSKLKWVSTPLYFKVKSDLSIRRAKTLIDIMMNKFGITQVTPFWSILVKPLENIEETNKEENVDQVFGISETIEETTPEVEETTDEVTNETVEPVEETSETTEEETSLEDGENVEEATEEVASETEETIEEVAEEITEERISEDEVSSEEGPQDVVIKKKRNPVVKFRTKLQSIDPDLLRKYEELTKYIEEYPLHGRISTMGHSYRLHTITYIVIQQRGDALRLHFKLNLEDLGEDNKIPAKDDSKKVKFALTPLMFKVKSDLSLRRAKELVDKTMEKANISKK